MIVFKTKYSRWFYFMNEIEGRPVAANKAAKPIGLAHTTVEEHRYDRINHRATGELAQAAQRSGTHLVFVSSIAAQSGSFSQRELTEDDTPQPNNAYGRSKLAAEHAVRMSGASFTILRPVVVYGEGEKGNFATCIRFHASQFRCPSEN